MAGSKTKPWNVTLTNVEPNEQFYIDYKEAAKINQTSVKFKTTPDRIKFWVTAHGQIYGDENLWQFKQNVVTLKVKEPNKGNLIVKSYLSTGVILVQGSEFPRWRLELYSTLKANVDLIQARSMAGGSTGSTGASARSDENNGSQGYSVHVEGDDTKL